MRGGAASALLLACCAASAQVPPLTTDGTTIADGWRVASLPRQTVPPTRFAAEAIDGVPALRVDSVRSYGNLVYRPATPLRVTSLRWRWRVDQGNAHADLRQKSGDDVTLRVCLSFAVPLDRLPFIDRQVLRFAGAAAGEPLPTTTLCWVWDERLDTGTLLPNAYTRRVRYIVARGRGQPLGAWSDEARDVAADFRRAFGDEIPELPAIDAVMVGADSDNTQMQTSGAVAALEVR